MKNPGEFVLALFNARTVAHIAHLQTSSYAAHKALNGFYDGIVGMADEFAEVYQGCYGRINFTAASYKLEKDPVKMLTELKATVAKARAECEETALQNILDGMTALIAQTLYLLTLK